MGTQGPRAASRHTGANNRHFAVRGNHLNAWCRVPGSPFADGLVLLPNRPGLEPPVVSFDAIDEPGVDALTCLFLSAPNPEHANRLLLHVRAEARSGEVLAETSRVLACGERAALSLRFAAQVGGVRLVVGLEFAEFAGGPVYGSVRMRYLAAYADNQLMRLFNSAGSDKGSEVSWGEGGVPHLYALLYQPLLAHLRDQPFRMLEIGLDTASQQSGTPHDAPSLRAWREFFPLATLYGYDIHDFSVFRQRDTHIFQGDQANPDDLQRFLELHGAAARFGVIIDDGSHVPSHQQTSLAHLFEHVALGGLYIIEDISWQPYEQSPSTGELLRAFIEHGRILSPFISAEASRRLEAAIDKVTIYRPNDSEVAVITRSAT